MAVLALIAVRTGIIISGRRRHAGPVTGRHCVLRHIIAAGLHHAEAAVLDDIEKSGRLQVRGPVTPRRTTGKGP